MSWKQSYELPEPAVEQRMPTRAELDETAMRLLLSAYARQQNFGNLQPRTQDALILRELGPLYDGPWRKKILKRTTNKTHKFPSAN